MGGPPRDVARIHHACRREVAAVPAETLTLRNCEKTGNHRIGCWIDGVSPATRKAEVTFGSTRWTSAPPTITSVRVVEQDVERAGIVRDGYYCTALELLKTCMQLPVQGVRSFGADAVRGCHRVTIRFASGEIARLRLQAMQKKVSEPSIKIPPTPTALPGDPDLTIRYQVPHED